MFLCSSFSIAAGGSLGPEAPLLGGFIHPSALVPVLLLRPPPTMFLSANFAQYCIRRHFRA